MPFQITAELNCEVEVRSTVLLGIHALRMPAQTLTRESFRVSPGVAWEELPAAAGGNRLIRLAMKMFGGFQHPYPQAVAIADWIDGNIDYLGGATSTETSAFDPVAQRAGVCRDFAHLGMAFCRALSIPARYFAGYACNLQPPDFHA